MKAFSVLEYLYRDASNYKAYGEVFLSGECSADLLLEIRCNLDEGIYFVPEHLGFEPLQRELYVYSNGSTSDDHYFHELIDIRNATSEETQAMQVWGSLS